MAAAREDADLETSSEDYARRFEGPVGAFFLERQARSTRDLLSPFGAASVLDVGGGHGQLAGPVAAAGHPVTVFGSDPRCRARVTALVDSGRARFDSGDLLALPYRDQGFDVVLCYRLLPHVARWGELIGELCRVARRAVIVDYPSRRSFNLLAGGLFAAKQGVEGNTRPFRVFRDADIRGAFAVHGFRPSARRPQFFLPMALHRAAGVAALSRVLEGVAAAMGLQAAFGSPVILRLERRG